MRQLALGPGAQVEQFQMGDEPLAAPEQFQRILYVQPFQAQDHLAGVQGHQGLQKDFGIAQQHRGQILVGRHGEQDIRVGLRSQPFLAQAVGHEAFHGFQTGGFFIRAVPPGIVAELFQSLFQGRLPLLEDVFGQMQGRRLALAHESQEGVRIQRGRGRDFQLAGQGGRVLLVPGLEQAQDMPAHPLVHRGVFLEDGRDVRALEQFDEGPAAVDVERRPGEFDELVMEGGPELDADAHGDAHDAGRAQQFAGGFGVHGIVVDHRDEAQALEPGIHDQMRGALAALGVGIMDVVVEGLLVPGFGHLQQMIAAQQRADDVGRAAHRLVEIVGQRQLDMDVRRGADQVFHDLDQDAGRILLQAGKGGVEDLVMQTAQGLQALLRTAGLQALQQDDDGAGDAHAGVRGQLDDAARMQAFFRLGQAHGHVAGGHETVDQLDQLMVLQVEQPGRLLVRAGSGDGIGRMSGGAHDGSLYCWRCGRHWRRPAVARICRVVPLCERRKCDKYRRGLQTDGEGKTKGRR